MMPMTIPVPKQQKPRLDYMRAKPPKESIKFNPKDPRFRFCYILHYPELNKAERNAMVEAMDELTKDHQVISVGEYINNYTAHYELIIEGHSGVVETIAEYWDKKKIDPELFADSAILDMEDYFKKKVAYKDGMFAVHLYEECLNEAIKLELKDTHRSNGTIIELNGTLKPDFTTNPNNPLGGVRFS